MIITEKGSPVLFFIVLSSLLLPSIVSAQEGVFVDRSAIEQNLDRYTGSFCISGYVENSLPIGVCDVVVKLYVPEAGLANAKTWEVSLSQINSHSTERFSFNVDPAEFEEYKTFVVQVYQYELYTENVREVLDLTYELNPRILDAAVRTLTRMIKTRPGIVDEYLASSTNIGRLCIAEAVLNSSDAKAMQYLAERFLTGHEVINQTTLKGIDALAGLVSEPSPFLMIERCELTGPVKTDVANMTRVLPSTGIPMLVRMSYTGTSEGRRFAKDYLQETGMDNFEKQFATGDNQLRKALVEVYKELSALIPSDMQIRHNLLIVELWRLVSSEVDTSSSFCYAVNNCLCSMEYTLSEGDAKSMQQMAERLLGGHDTLDTESLKLLGEISVIADLMSKPSPFPQLARWKPKGNPQNDLENMIPIFPGKAIPMLIRMRYIGTKEGRQFAENYLQKTKLSGFETQLSFTGIQGQTELVNVYRELTYSFPNDIDLRHSAAIAEIRTNIEFPILALVVSVISPFIWARRRSGPLARRPR